MSEPVRLLHVLLVEDDPKLARLTRDYLEQHQVTVTWVADGRSAIRAGANPEIDAIVLDIMLPDLDGFEVCRAIRATSNVPIIAVTARIELEDRVLGLELGADDYVTKPFSARELLARIHAAVRRAHLPLTRPAPTELRVGRLTINSSTVQATLDNVPLDLTSYEFALLRVLCEHAGHVLSREQLLELAKGNADEAFERSIDVRVSKLRQKLGDDPKRPHLLKTIRGVGYLLNPEPASDDFR